MRRRVTAAVLAALAALWLTVAAVGKGGSSPSATKATTQPAPSLVPDDGESYGRPDDDPSQATPSGPLTTRQS